jgi:hypothetical protein
MRSGFVAWRRRTTSQTKKDRVACWKAAMGQSACGKLVWRWSRTCAAVGRRACVADNWGGGPRPSKAVRMADCPWSNRFQMRWKVRSLERQLVAWMAVAMLPTTACWRNVHRVRVVMLRRRILSASQTLKVRPQPGRCRRLLQKRRRARSVCRCGVRSSNPKRAPCRMSVPTVLQWGQEVCLSCSTIAIQSWSDR